MRRPPTARFPHWRLPARAAVGPLRAEQRSAGVLSSADRIAARDSRRARRRRVERHPAGQRQLHADAGRNDRRVAAAARHRSADRLAHRQPRLLSRARHSDRPRPRLHRRRSLPHRAGDDCQPGDRAEVLGRRRSDRPHAASPRRYESVHGRRRRRRRAALGAQSGIPVALLSERRPRRRPDGRRRARRRRSAGGAADRPAKSARARSAAAAVERADDGRD